ncbi:hypothetical protein CU098_012743 [Rhizopus stolonifer]|uniref:Uncharacterized protein n=1 Tax=Rhizopus stolonifer TaxID=4846 RepID=A0A367KUD4_RHIST|nr:hypothetical protein CU098_012743 [Rhizopus stolonifer]
MRRGLAYGRQFVAYQLEYNSKLRSLDMKEQLDKLNNDVSRSAPGSEQQNVEKGNNSVASIIKRKAVKYRERYHSIETSLNSILNVSFNFPDCQSKLFTNQEWLGLREKYRPVGYSTTEYGRARSILQLVFQAYRQIKTFGISWVEIYKEAKKLEKHYDPVFIPKGDIHITLHDTVSKEAPKVDFRVVKDKTKQRYYIEHDVTILEAAE